MINQETTENVDLETVERQTLVQKYEALKRLKENKDFQLLILEGYLKESAIDKVSLLSTEYIRRGNLRGVLMEQLVAISAFEEYLHMVENLGAPVDEDEDEEVEG